MIIKPHDLRAMLRRSIFRASIRPLVSHGPTNFLSLSLSLPRRGAAVPVFRRRILLSLLSRVTIDARAREHRSSLIRKVIAINCSLRIGTLPLRFGTAIKAR
jgi:hypothetical protein